MREAEGGREVYEKKKGRRRETVSEVREKESKGEEMGVRKYVCDSPCSAGEQRKDKQVKNTAGYHPSALESFSYTLPLISAELHTMETILYTGQESQQMQTHIITKLPLCTTVQSHKLSKRGEFVLVMLSVLHRPAAPD